jgi:DHA1 family multidrug resistance protein-like MFS transporter
MILIGLGGVFFEMPYQSAVAILTTDENRPRYYSLNNTITGVASAIGPLLGVALLRLDFKMVCFGAALCFFVNFILSCSMMPPIIRQEKSYPLVPVIKKIAKDKPYLAFVLIMMIFWLGASQIDITYPLRVQEVYGSADGVGVMYTVYAVVMAVLQYPLVALTSKKFSSRMTVVIGIGIIAVALVTTAFVGSTVPFMVIVAVYAVGMILARPNQQNIAVSMADSRALGMYLGVNSMAFAIGKGAGTIIGGAAFDMAKKYGLGNIPWYFFCALALISMLGFLSQRKLGTAQTAASRE